MILNSPYISGSLTVTGNTNLIGALTVTGSLAGTATSSSFAFTASSAVSAYTAASAVNATTALTASYATSFTVGGTLTAQTLVVQTITSSTDFVTGSTRFGSLLTNTHQFTGSVSITGSLIVNTTGTEFQVTNNGVVMGNLSTDNHTITGSLNITGSVGINAASSFRFNGIGDTSHAVGYDSTVDGAFLRGQNGVRFITGTGGGTERMRISAAGTASFTGNSLTSAADAATINLKQNSTTANTGIYLERSGEQKGYYIYMGGSVDSLTFQRNNAGTKGDVMSLTRDGNVGIGTTSPQQKLHVEGDVYLANNRNLFFANSGVAAGAIRFYNSTSSTTKSIIGSYLNIADEGNIEFANGASLTTKMIITSRGHVGISVTPNSSWGTNMAALQIGSGGVLSNFTGANNNFTAGANYYDNGAGSQLRLYTGGTSYIGFNEDVITFASAGSNSAGTSISFTERMRISAGGYLKLKTVSAVLTTTTHRLDDWQLAQGSTILVSGNASAADSIIIYSVDSAGANAAATALAVGKHSSTNRSINAGGSINASGADYAEYMVKAITDNIAKGDIVGVNSEGKLTNIFNDAISFTVKSTDPAYVGNDTWGSVGSLNKPISLYTEEELQQYKETNEAIRTTVDRIAFSGQVPCNVTGANVGDYIIPVQLENGKIGGQAITNPTFEQYQTSVGKVWKIMEDGRAWIAVKIG
jgi:hypothetical protein